MAVGKSERFEMRLDSTLLARVDGWRQADGGGASRSEAVRQLTQIGLDTRTSRQTFLQMKFQILQAALNPATAPAIGDAYAYAWDRDIYPWFHDAVDWHKAFEHDFRVSASMMKSLMTYLDALWLKQGPTPTFYELENHFDVRERGEWDRSMLIGACRYAFLSRRFDEALFARLVKPTEHPIEAAAINEPFERADEIGL